MTDLTPEIIAELERLEQITRDSWSSTRQDFAELLVKYREQVLKYAPALIEAAKENARLKKSINDFGNNPAGFDWAVLDRIAQLEAELAALRERCGKAEAWPNLSSESRARLFALCQLYVSTEDKFLSDMAIETIRKLEASAGLKPGATP